MPFTDFFIDYVPMYAKFRTVASILVIAEFTIPFLAMLALKKFIEEPVCVKCKRFPKLNFLYLSLGLTGGIALLFALMPTLFFDEIDSGVSGSAADRMGSMICDMGRNMQVFAITHLPQVAAKGDAHYLVSKSGDASGRTVSSITRLDEEERVMEVARMLSGTVVTDAAVANARALLKP
jgi:DNA repair protein RecN (Recombination protein N)